MTRIHSDGALERALSVIARLERENYSLRDEVETLRAQNMQDALTGLKNRRYFDERLAAEVDRARREKIPVSVLVIDLDDFKAINDSHGHLVGDEMLVWAADFLRDQVREHDVCCRTGGDEFMVILPNADRPGCTRVTHRLRRALRNINAHRVGGHLSFSMGAATFGDAHNTPALMTAAADAAMYDDKREGKATRAARAARSRRQAEGIIAA